MTRQIAQELENILKPGGVAVIVEGVHLCARMGGVKQDQTSMVTQTMLGAYNTDDRLRQEFLAFIHR